MRVGGHWLEREETQTLLALLTDAGHQALPVGGCVRNAIFRLPVADVDVSTDARPERVMELAKAAGLRVVPTGIDHGTVTVLVGGEAYEVTTFRQDINTDGRHAIVSFATTPDQDALRRDFTMNALYVHADGRVIDPTGLGIADALARRIRFVGVARDRIHEDYLRILRFFRFYAWYGDAAEGPDPEALAACAEGADGIDGLSHERLGAEMRKLLAAPDPCPSVASMAATGVLAHVLPGADARFLPLLVHFEQGAAPDWLARLAILGGQDVADQLRLSRAEAKDLAAIQDGLGSTQSAAALGFLHGARVAQAVLLGRAAMFEAPPPQGWQEEVARGAASDFPIRAADLPTLSGPALGQRLRALQQLWLAGDLRPTREALLAADVQGPAKPL